MAWVATAVIGGSIIGGGMGMIGSSMAADATAEAAATGANAQLQSTKLSNEAQNKMYDTTRADFSPFLQPSGRAMATLQSAIYGGSQGYNDPSYRFDRETGKYIGPNGESVDRPPQLSAMFNPQESEAYKWQRERGLQDLSRVLRMHGRDNSTYGFNTTGRFLGDLNAGESDKQYGRLLDLTKIGQGAAGSTGSAGASAAGNISNGYLQAGQGASNAALMAGQAKGSLYSGMGGAALGGIGTGMNLYSLGKQGGWWGGGSDPGFDAYGSVSPGFLGP